MVAIFLTSFNLYRSGTADIRVFFDDLQLAQFIHEGGHAGLPQHFVCALHGNIANFGSTGAVFQRIDFVGGLNGIMDQFVVNGLGVSLATSSLVKGSSTSIYWHKIFAKDRIVELPLVMEPGHICPFTVFVELFLNKYVLDEIETTVEWLQEVNIIFHCYFLQQGGSGSQKIVLKIDPLSLKDSVAETVSSLNRPKNNS